ncbi:MAG: glutamine amidotransferase [Scrofimicrobium sp.]
MARVLFAGESEVVYEMRQKGFDTLHSTVRTAEARRVIDALEARGHSVTWLNSEEVGERFPYTLEELDLYDVVILSDVGSNTFLIPRAVHEGFTRPNRLRLLRNWVSQGGALLMCGGWLSFAGMGGAANYSRTPIEELLPVKILPFDDRVEEPEGTYGCVVMPEHPIVDGLPSRWPPLLGYNYVEPSEGADVVVRSDIGDPLLVTWEYGEGRAAAWTSDIAPHWISKEFESWEGYPALFNRAVTWLAGESLESETVPTAD